MTTGNTMKHDESSGVDLPRLVRLLPCPFCGTESGTPTGPMYLKNGDMWEGMMHDIHCISCTVTMSDYSREKVEAKWNLRCLPNSVIEQPVAE
jgi:hypothetical protein